MMNAMDREQFEERCAAYLLGAMEPEERRAFESTLATADAEQTKLYHEMQSAALHLAVASPQHPAPSSVRERLLAAVGAPRMRTAPLESFAVRLGFGRPAFGFVVAAALLVTLTATVLYSLRQRAELSGVQGTLSVVTTELTSARTRLASLQDTVEQKEAILRVLQAPRIEIVILNGQEVNPGGYGKILWDPEKKSAILQISHLPALPANKDYQLWVIKEKKPLSAGVFAAGGEGAESVFRIADLVETDKKSISAFAITMEPKGGVDQPTGKIYLLGAPSQ
jgi:anti-sigma-K factor RskA